MDDRYEREKWSFDEVALLIQDAITTMRAQRGPVLFNDLVGALRCSARGGISNVTGRRWRNLNACFLEIALRRYGCHFARRRHGSGVAIYVASHHFDQVTDGRGKVRKVEGC